jgi:M6 family metalloprotease-like protein
MKKLIYLIVLLAATIYGPQALAIPAYPGLITLTQPSGETVQLYQIGDEYGHFFRTPDGHAVIDDEGALCYASLLHGQPVSSGILVHDAASRTPNETAFIATLDDESIINAFSARRKASIPQSGLGTKGSTAFPTTGSPKAIVILVEFSDVKFTDNVSRFSTTTPNAYFTDMLNKSNFSLDSAWGSAKDYYESASNGVFTPQFDVYGPYTLSHAVSYYGADSGSTHDTNKSQLIKDACSAANSDINFKDYAYSGSVPFVYVFYAGIGQNLSGVSTDIWPAAGSLGSYYDLVKVDRYACSNAVNSSYIPMGIGSFIHEFSHILGLPDLYSGDLTVTPGNWSVMDSGTYLNDSRCPAGYGAYERNALKWTEPTVLSGDDEISLKAMSLSNQCCIIQTKTTNEFFLLENRQRYNWDSYLPGHGLLIWHIDYDSSAFSSGPNSNSSHQRVDIVEANGNPVRANTTYEAGYTFPGTSGMTSFTSSTTPALQDWNGNAIDTPISQITENGSVVSFSVGNGIPFVHNTITATAATNVSSESFTANWEEVSDATGYYLTVMKGNDTGTTTATADAGTNTYSTTVPSGWGYSFDRWNIYNDQNYSSDYYGAASPAYQLINTQYLSTPTYSLDLSRISFWYRGVGTSSSTLTVEGLVNDSWVTIETITLNSSSPATKSYSTSDKIPAGVKQARFTFTDLDNGGALALDDVSITIGTVAEVVAGYDNLYVDNVLSKDVTGLTGGAGAYYSYTVYATNGSANTAESNRIAVTLTDTDPGTTPDPGTEPDTSGDGSYTIPSGKAYDNVYLTKIESQNAATDYTYTWTEHPDDLYTLLDQHIRVNQGASFNINVDYYFNGSESTSNSMMYLYSDWDADGSFDLEKTAGNASLVEYRYAANETELTAGKLTTLTVPDDAPVGWTRLRIILNYRKSDLNDGANSTNLEKARVYDIPVYIAGTVSYGTPSGTTYDANYLTLLRLTTDENNQEYTWDAHPGTLYNLLGTPFELKTNDALSLKMTAYSLGSGSTSTVYEDMRYNCAYIFTDWYGDGTLTLDETIGNKPPTNNVYGNYDEVMDIDKSFTVPDDANLGAARIRVIYQNAWTALDDANASNITKGIVYDIPILITSIGTGIERPETITDATPQYFTIQGLRVAPDRLSPGIYIRKAGDKVEKVLITY